MNVKFKQLQIQNFKSVGELVVVDFEHLTGLNYIFGTNLDYPSSRNGCGKSAIMIDALVFALYGRTIKNTNNQYLPNRYCDKKLKTYVKLYFEVDGILYTSECSCRPYIKSVSMTLQQFDPEKEEWLDLTQSSVIKTKQYIAETVLNCSFDLFKSSIVISASDCLNFYEGMTKQEKRNYVENIFNLNCFGVMFNMIKSDLNDLKREITYNNNEIIKTTTQLENFQKKSQEYQDKLNENLTLLQDQLELKEADLTKINNAKTAIEKKLEQYNSNEDEYKTLNKNLKKFISAKSAVEKQIVKHQSNIEHIQQTLNEVIKIKEGLCETCKGVINNYYNYDEKIKQIENINNLITEDNNKVSKLNEAITKTQSKIEKQEEENKIISKYKNDLNKLVPAVKVLQTEIKRIKQQLKDSKENKNNPFLEMIIKTEEELNRLTEQTSTYHTNLKHLDILKEVCSENGVKSFIIKDIVKLLNSLIQKYLNEIGAEYLVYFDESFEFKFVTMTGECEYTNFSAGERQRIQIATLFAFRDLILNGKITANIFIIDEFLDSAIDSICIKNVLEILYKKVTEQHQNIFIISHRQETTEQHIFNNIIEVIKENGKSTLKIN